MNMEKEHLEFLRLSRIVTTKTVTNLRLSSMVYPYAMVAM